MSVTFAVSQLLTSSEVRAVQFEKVLYRVVTFAVFQLLMSSELSFWQK